MLFSYRQGYKKLRDAIQIDSVDEATRNLLWSALCEFYWNRISVEYVQFHGSTGRFFYESRNNEYRSFFRNYWLYYLRNPIDTFDDNWTSFKLTMREHFFSCKWYELFDYLEFVYANIDIYQATEDLLEAHNNIFESEKVSYRIVNGKITEITSKEEIAEIEQALAEDRDTVRVHLDTSLNFLSDRKTPDYRNSVKESISAVEALCKDITRAEKATLADALKIISKDARFHPAFLNALDKLYGYTSDESGIRHSLIDMSRIDFADAKFMLVACSAFVNYIRTKMAK